MDTVNITHIARAVPPLRVAVIGAGISGLSCAWLLNRDHDVVLYEAAPRLGGHSLTVDVPAAGAALPVDMGFIVYNEPNYPNLTALFEHLGVTTKPTNMGFAVSLDGGRIEYGGDSLPALFAQTRNLASPRFWSMLVDLTKFYREAPAHAAELEARGVSLGEFLDDRGYGEAFQQDHLLPQAAAIWSMSVADMRSYPAAAFIRFFDNHGLLKVFGRPQWRTVDGGSRAYVSKLAGTLAGSIRAGAPVAAVIRAPSGVTVQDQAGGAERFDHVVMATHADDGLRLLSHPTNAERLLLGALGYRRNIAVLHSDSALMPKRQRTWSAWNYIGNSEADGALCVTYWMNRLQGLPMDLPLFVTLNPIVEPDQNRVIHTQVFDHPVFNQAALDAQTRLWSLQGHGGVWWCGAYFGAGFHEDGLQAGLAVAEMLGGGRRPWTVPNESGRIYRQPASPVDALGLAA